MWEQAKSSSLRNNNNSKIITVLQFSPPLATARCTHTHWQTVAGCLFVHHSNHSNHFNHPNHLFPSANNAQDDDGTSGQTGRESFQISHSDQRSDSGARPEGLQGCPFSQHKNSNNNGNINNSNDNNDNFHSSLGCVARNCFKNEMA